LVFFVCKHLVLEFCRADDDVQTAIAAVNDGASESEDGVDDATAATRRITAENEDFDIAAGIAFLTALSGEITWATIRAQLSLPISEWECGRGGSGKPSTAPNRLLGRVLRAIYLA
jgi:hypothetical protein